MQEMSKNIKQLLATSQKICVTNMRCKILFFFCRAEEIFDAWRRKQRAGFAAYLERTAEESRPQIDKRQARKRFGPYENHC
jgi:hypothetical protein